MKLIAELNDQVILGTGGLSTREPRITARAIVRNPEGLYAVMYAEKFGLHSLPGGGVERGEDVLAALRREVYEKSDACVIRFVSLVWLLKTEQVWIILR